MLFLLPFLIGCTGDDLPPSLDFGGPMDDVLRMHHIQAVGTHNSYHSDRALGRPEWDYYHRPLWEQAAFQGVRQFELDLWWNDEREAYDVLHIPALDPISSCPTLRDCLWAQRVWSDSEPGHHPIVTLLEVKDTDPGDDAIVAAHLEELEQALLEIWSRERLITPDDVRGDADTVRDALTEDGWPLLGGLRGRAIYVLHVGGVLRRVYTQDGEDVPGTLIFQDAYGNLDLPYAAIHSMNNPYDAHIADVVAAGHLVRTRSDSDGDEARANDTAKRDQAIASGAHFISTDFPVPHVDTGYVVQMEEGAPSRCNPMTAPEGCTSDALEYPYRE